MGKNEKIIQISGCAYASESSEKEILYALTNKGNIYKQCFVLEIKKNIEVYKKKWVKEELPNDKNIIQKK